MSGRFHIQERVRWSDADVSGIIRWDAYTRFVELAETELFRAAGFPYGTAWDALDIWLPRVQFHVEMRNPVRLDDLLDVEFWVGRIGRSSIRFEFALRNGATPVADGHLVAVALGRKTGRPVAVPAALGEALAAYRAG